MNNKKKMRATGFEPATVGFGVQRSTVGATPSYDNRSLLEWASSVRFLINHGYILFPLGTFIQITFIRSLPIIPIFDKYHASD